MDCIALPARDTSYLRTTSGRYKTTSLVRKNSSLYDTYSPYPPNWSIHTGDHLFYSWDFEWFFVYHVVFESCPFSFIHTVGDWCHWLSSRIYNNELKLGLFAVLMVGINHILHHGNPIDRFSVGAWCPENTTMGSHWRHHMYRASNDTINCDDLYWPILLVFFLRWLQVRPIFRHTNHYGMLFTWQNGLILTSVKQIDWVLDQISWLSCASSFFPICLTCDNRWPYIQICSFLVASTYAADAKSKFCTHT